MSDDDDKVVPLPRRSSSDLGDSAPDQTKSASSAEILEELRILVKDRLSKCITSRDVLEMEADTLAECVGIASEIYKSGPTPDNSYQLAALANSHKALIAQLEKMKDPTVLQVGIEEKIREMFQSMTKALGVEIYKTKNHFLDHFPEQKSDIESYFGNMLEAIQPESQRLYADLSSSIKKALGIKIE